MVIVESGQEVRFKHVDRLFSRLKVSLTAFGILLQFGFRE
jgi:hypothetical protein